MVCIELRDVGYLYRTKYQTTVALDGVSYKFEAAKVYAVVGSSGSGKTTMLSLMAGLDVPTNGDILCWGESTGSINLEKYRREKVAVIYQNYRLFPLLTVAENVMFPMELKGIKPREAREKAINLIEKVGLPGSAHNRYPTMLSGGEQQRVAIARAIGTGSKILLADEPTGNLDTSNSENIANLLCELAHNEGYCVIIATHDMELAARADYIIRLSDGAIKE